MQWELLCFKKKNTSISGRGNFKNKKLLSKWGDTCTCISWIVGLMVLNAVGRPAGRSFCRGAAFLGMEICVKHRGTLPRVLYVFSLLPHYHRLRASCVTPSKSTDLKTLVKIWFSFILLFILIVLMVVRLDYLFFLFFKSVRLH